MTGNSNKSESEKIYKSNVVLVIDVSGSMGNNVSRTAYTYSKDTYDPDGSYRGRNNSYYQWQTVHYDTDRSQWYYTNYYGNRTYLNANAQIQTNFDNRLDATKSAARVLVRNLLANNQEGVEGKEDIIEISIEKFANKTETTNQWGNLEYNGTKVIISKSTDEKALISAINGLTAAGGTHWEAALSTAKTEIGSYPISTDPDVVETNYVIFLTDGFPTMYGDDVGGYEYDEYISRAFYEALDDGRAIVNDITTFYTIFAFGDDTRHGESSGTYNTGRHTGYQFLCGLTNYAYKESVTTPTSLSDVVYTEDAEHCFDASDTSALQEAFAKISDKINNNVGFGGVEISDGLSVGSTNSAIAVDGTVHPESFVYSVYDTDNDKTLLYTVTFTYGDQTDAQGNKVPTGATFKNRFGDTLSPVTRKTVTTELPAPTETDPDHKKTVTTEVFSVPYGTGAGATTYMMTPATVQTNGMIDWNLAGLGILEKWTYELSFKVWPNQPAYDIAADLNNGLYNGSLEAAVADYVANGKITQTEGNRLLTTMQKDPATGLYVINTNYSQDISYHQAEIHQQEGQDPVTHYGEPQSDPIDPIPNPIPLTGSLIPMEKRWGSELAIIELQELVFGKDNTYRGYNVTLKLKRDGADYMEYTFPKLNSSGQPVDKNGNVTTDVTKLVWQQDAAIAPGRMVTEDPGGTTHKTVTLSGVDKDGNDISGTYYIINDGHEYEIQETEGSDLHFEFSTDIYHPMLVNGQLMNIKFDQVGTNGTIADKSTAEVIDPEMTTVYATNTLKGGLNIRKKVSSTPVEVKETTDEQQVTTREIIGYTEVENCTDEFTFEITLTENGTPFGTPADQYTYTEPSDMTGWSKDTTDPENPFWYKSGFSAYNVYDGSNKRVQRAPIPADGKLTVTMPADGEIRVVNLPTDVTYTVKEVVDENADAAYHYALTASAIKTGEDAEGKDILDGEPVLTTGNTVTGTIAGNRAKLETYYNWAANFYVYHSSSNKIEKVSFADERVSGKYVEATDGNPAHYKYTFNIVEETGRNSATSEAKVVPVKDDEGNTTYYFTGGFHYGGYYQAFGGTSLTKAQIVGTSEEGKVVYDETSWASDPSGSVYDGTLLKPAGKTTRFWTKSDACRKVRGDEMEPEVNGVYYLKEVPVCYLQTHARWVYDWADNNKIIAIYLLTTMDDTFYKEAGYTVIANENPTNVFASSFSYQQRGETTVNKVKVADLAGQRGYMAVVSISDQIAAIESAGGADDGVVVKPYWKTLDTVKVATLGYWFYNGNPGSTLSHDKVGYTPNTEY